MLAKNGNKMKRVSFTCSLCRKSGFNSKEIAVDHILPVVDPHLGFQNFGVYVERLFCDENNYQTICHGCHKIKTNIENKGRNGNDK